MARQPALVTNDLGFELLEQILRHCAPGTAARLAMGNKRLYMSQRSTFGAWRLQYYLTNCFTLRLIPTTSERGVYCVDYDTDDICTGRSERDFLHSYLIATISPLAELEVIQHARILSSDVLMQGLGLADTVAVGLLEELLRKACSTATNEGRSTCVKLFVVVQMSMDQLFSPSDICDTAGQAETEDVHTAGGRRQQADGGSSACRNADCWKIFMDIFLNGIEGVLHHAFCKNCYYVGSPNHSLFRASYSEFKKRCQTVIPSHGHYGVRVVVHVHFRDSTDTAYQPHDSGRLFPDRYDWNPGCKISRQMLRKISQGFSIPHYFHIPHGTW